MAKLKGDQLSLLDLVDDDQTQDDWEQLAAKLEDLKFWSLNYNGWCGEFVVTRRRLGKLWIYLKVFDLDGNCHWSGELDQHDKYFADLEFELICRRLDYQLRKVATDTLKPQNPTPCVRGLVPDDITHEQVDPSYELTHELTHEQSHWVEVYSVVRSSKTYKYFRYCWVDGGRRRCQHIGSVNSPTAIAKKEFARLAIASGSSPSQIVQNLKSKI